MGQLQAIAPTPAISSSSTALPPETPTPPTHRPSTITGTPPGTIVIRGRLPNSPKVKYNLNATGEFPFGNDSKALVTLGYQHQGKVNFDLFGNPRLTERAYGIFNGSVGAEFGNGFKATVFVNNLFDKHYAASLSDGFQTLGGSVTNPAHVIYQFQPRDSERYFGVKLGYSF